MFAMSTIINVAEQGYEASSTEGSGLKAQARAMCQITFNACLQTPGFGVIMDTR